MATVSIYVALRLRDDLERAAKQDGMELSEWLLWLASKRQKEQQNED
jgi:hypothetical protein